MIMIDALLHLEEIIALVLANFVNGRTGSQRRAAKLRFGQKPNSAVMLNLGCRMHVQPMKTLLNDRERNEVLHRLSRVRSDCQRRWGSMSAHQIQRLFSCGTRRKANQLVLHTLQTHDL